VTYKIIAASSSRTKEQTPKVLETTLRTGEVVEGPQHKSLNNTGYKETWISITTPEPLRGATSVDALKESSPLGEKMDWNATRMHTLQTHPVLASQAPYGAHFVSAFLTLLIEQKIEHIVALATPDEQDGYTRYVPTQIGTPLQFPGGFSVTLLKEEKHPFCTINTLEITDPTGQPHRLTQHLYATWPNKGFPPQAEILPFVHHVHANAFTKGPTLVHCNAGIGRTGSLLALECIVRSQNHMERSEVDILLETLSNERPGPQKEDQKEAIINFASSWKQG
jgi:protein tyrosine phosphatase